MRVHYFLSASHGHTLRCACVLTHPLTQLNSTDLARVPQATSKTWISPSQCSLRPRSSADGCASQRKTSAWPPPQVRQGWRLQRGSCSEDACTPAPLCRRLSTLGTETCTVSQDTLERCGQNSGQILHHHQQLLMQKPHGCLQLLVSKSSAALGHEQGPRPREEHSVWPAAPEARNGDPKDLRANTRDLITCTPGSSPPTILKIRVATASLLALSRKMWAPLGSSGGPAYGVAAPAPAPVRDAGRPLSSGYVQALVALVEHDCRTAASQLVSFSHTCLLLLRLLASCPCVADVHD